MPQGSAANDMLIWDGTAWALLDGPTAHYQVLQYGDDDVVAWGWVKAH